MAAVSTNEDGNPLRAKVCTVGSFTRKAIANRARANLLPGCDVRSDGLSCFAGVVDAGCADSYVVVGRRKPREMLQFTRVNTVLVNLKTMIGGGYKFFKFHKYAGQYLGAFAYRFNRRFYLPGLLLDLINLASCSSPTPERLIRRQAETRD